MDDLNRLPTWAPGVPKKLSRRFYETDAKGIYDEDLIDRVIHGFHWYMKGRWTTGPTRPVAVNRIEGRVGDVVAFLDEITYSDKSTPGMAENRAEWDANIHFHHEWYASRRKAAPPQA